MEKDFEREAEKCMGCLIGTTVCPVFESYGDRAVYTNTGVGIIAGAYHMEKWKLEPDERFIQSVYECTNCGACERVCRNSLNVTHLINHIRSTLVERGLVPSTIRDALRNSLKYGNPWGKLQNMRDQWAEQLNIKRFSEGEKHSILLYVGCTPSYDTRCQEVARSMVAVLNRAEVDYGILGNDEKCCGDQILKMGEKGLFDMLAEQNINLLNKYGINRIVTMSPHCYNTFKNDYPCLGGKYEVQHYSQFLLELIDEGELRFSKKVDKAVTYHDPCFLGRHNDIYEAPRRILEAIPGLKLVEMPRNREDSFCCGGGGGRMWIDEKSGEHVSTIRAREAVSVNTDMIATACPFCLVNLEDGIKALDKNGNVMVKDIIELVNEAT